MTINGSTNNNQWTYKLEVSETGYSVQDRTSTVQVKTYIGRASSQSYLGGGYNSSVSVTGASSQSKSGNIPYPTYINGGAWLELQTFTFTVPNTGNPTTITISSSMSSSNFTPSSCSASGTMQLTVLHLDPVINTATIVETNSVLTALSVPDTTIVRYLSKKTITLNVTTYDSATPTYRLRHLNSDYALPSSSTYQSSNVFNTDYTTHDVVIGDGKANLIQDIKDSLNGTATDWVYVSINGTAQKPNGIPYAKPTIERANTSIKRKSGGGTTLTDNKAVLNLKATFYKSNDVIGNNNNIQQIGYKIWLQSASEPSSYTTLTPTISGSNITISNLEISNMVYTKVYNYKIILKDRFGYQDIVEGSLPTGESTWTEYKDRVDFKEITIGQSKKLSLLGQSIRVKMSASQTISRNTTTKVNTNTLDYNDSTALTLTNSAVYIGKGVSSVLVNCRYTAWGANSGGRYIYVYKNGATFAFNNSSYSHTMETTVIVPVKENDYIEMYCYNEQSETFEISSTDNQTFLQVTILG